jgi:hypothetical protein
MAAVWSPFHPVPFIVLCPMWPTVMSFKALVEAKPVLLPRELPGKADLTRRS